MEGRLISEGIKKVSYLNYMVSHNFETITHYRVSDEGNRNINDLCDFECFCRNHFVSPQCRKVDFGHFLVPRNELSFSKLKSPNSTRMRTLLRWALTLGPQRVGHQYVAFQKASWTQPEASRTQVDAKHREPNLSRWNIVRVGYARVSFVLSM